MTSNLHTVDNGLEAVRYLKGEGEFADRAANPFPDVMLLDLNMPRMNGFEVLQWIRGDAQCSRLVVHVLTASARDTDVQRAYDLRANSYVTKPTRMPELVEFAGALQQWHRFTIFPKVPPLARSGSQ